ncbi:MAG TPA: hypothetical protein VF219_23265 [Vicinamibacterales bacterium]
MRQHFSVTSPSGIDDFVLTRIQNLSEADDKTVVLIRTASGGHFIVTHEWNYETQVSYSEIREQRSGDFLRVSVTSSAAATSAARKRKRGRSAKGEFW